MWLTDKSKTFLPPRQLLTPGKQKKRAGRKLKYCLLSQLLTAIQLQQEVGRAIGKLHGRVLRSSSILLIPCNKVKLNNPRFHIELSIFIFIFFYLSFWDSNRKVLSHAFSVSLHMIIFFTSVKHLLLNKQPDTQENSNWTPHWSRHTLLLAIGWLIAVEFLLNRQLANCIIIHF